MVELTRHFESPKGLTQGVVDYLAEAIIYNELKPGQRLREEELARKFQISRSPIREAFRILEQEGLTVFMARRGVQVSLLSRRLVREIYECRAVLEGFAAGCAADHLTPQSMDRLNRIYARMVAAAKRKEVRGYFKENVKLQGEIRELSGNSVLARLLGSLGRQTLRYRYIVYEMVPEMIDISLRRNGEILKALEMRDAARVRQLTEHLILEAGQHLMKELPEARLVRDSLEIPPQSHLSSERRGNVDIHSD